MITPLELITIDDLHLDASICTIGIDLATASDATAIVQMDASTGYVVSIKHISAS